MDVKIFRINYKSDFILTLNSDAGWMTPFCIKFWTGAPSQAYYVGWDGVTYNHCSFDPSEPTKLLVQFDDHHLPIGDLKFQIAYHFTVADFPNDTEDEVINPASITTEIDGQEYQVMLDFTGETAPEIEFSLPAYANEAQRIANEQQRIEKEQQRIDKEQQRIANEETRQAHEVQRIAQETARVNEFATLKAQSQAATSAANTAAALANEKAQLAADKSALAQAAATLANQKAQLAADKAALANAAAQLANEKAALAQQKAEYAQQQGGYAKDQGDYAKNQGDYAKEQGDTALADHQRADADHGIAVDDHTQAGNDHTRAESDHGIAVDDHTQAGNDHIRAESDHGIASDDHTQAGNDHTRAESDHGIASDDHTQAGNDHTRAESDHTRAESDHAAVEVYIDSLGAFDISAYHATGGVLAKYSDLTEALGTNGANIPDALRKGGMSVKFVQSSDNKYVQFRFLLSGSFTDTQFTNASKWLSENVDTTVTQGSVNLISSGAVANKINIITDGVNTNYDPTVLYLVISSQSTLNADLRSVWDNTNIKNETSGTCTIDWGYGQEAVAITSRDSLQKSLVAGTYIVAITGVTSLNGNLLMRESTILIDAKIPNTLTTINNWLFNGVTMSEVTFMAKVPPTFGSTGQSDSSLNLVTKIKVPKSSLSAYQASSMSNAMKAKLEGYDEGINGDIVELKDRVNEAENNIAQTQEDLTELSNHVDKLHKTYDKTKSYFTVEVTSSLPYNAFVSLWGATNIKNETAGTCFVDWGDGTSPVPIMNDDSLKHTYAQNGIYEITITGLKGLTSNMLFREVNFLKSAKFGNTFVSPSTYYMLNNSEVESVEFFATTPLTWGTTSVSNMNLVDKIIVPKDSLFKYLDAWYFDSISQNKDTLTKKIFPDEDVDFIYNNIEVTVGNDGDFQTISKAIRYLSTIYPIYKYGGVKAIIKILSGTVITNQVYVDALDLSWITIEYEDYNPESLNYDSVAGSIANGTIVFDTTEGYNSVSVDATNFSSTSHDLRGDFTLFRAENGARLPIIGCVFKLTTPHATTGIAGIVCNRGSEAVVKTLCGFIGFQDGVISNNESSITIREGITMNCSRWGCHARHNGEVSARSVIATGCATNTTYASEYGAAVADRVADMDVREAYLGGNYAIRCHNASSICARATHVIGGGIENAYLVQATYSGKINASQMTFAGITEGSKMFEVQYAGWIDAFSVTNKTYNVSTLNTIDINGIIFG